MGIAISALAGCCNCLQPPPKNLSPLPAPITLQQQLDLLNQRSVSIPRLYAISSSNGVEFLYPGPDGKIHHDSLDGKLWLQQTPETHSANLRLTGRILGQTAFQVGRNPKERWCELAALNGNPAQGFVTPADRELDLQSVLDMSTGSSIMLLSDFIPKVLALTEIQPESGEAIAYRVNDDTGMNEILIEHLRDDGTAWIERSISIDRRTGDVRNVSLFNEAGVPLITATLGNYETIKASEQAVDKAESHSARVPMNVIIDCPSRKVKISLSFDTVQIPPPQRILPTMFDTPDWESEGVKAQYVGGGEPASY